MEQYSEQELAAMIPALDASANKYTRGKLLLFAGSVTYPGAACLAAVASQRMGAGYTEVFSDKRVVSQLQLYRASLVVRPFEAWDATREKPADVHHPHAFAIGSGFDASDTTCAAQVERVLAKAQAPVLVDGGGLQALCTSSALALCKQRFERGFATVLTPHKGEAARLADAAGCKATQQDVLACELAKTYHAIVALKGPNTHICDGKRCFCLCEGTPALAKAGTGDVLAGIIAALLAQGSTPFEACVLGTTLHARSGNRAALVLGKHSVCAEDVITYLSATIMQLEDKCR